MTHVCSVHRVGSKSKASRESTPLAASRSAGDQLMQMQSTDALLNELFQGLLKPQQQSRELKGSRTGGYHGRNKSEQAELTAEAEAKIAKACSHVMCMYRCMVFFLITQIQLGLLLSMLSDARVHGRYHSCY